MGIDIRQVGPEALGRYARVPIRFTVEAVLDVIPADGGLGGLRLVERAAGKPYLKDYDACAWGVMSWAERFDVSRWLFLLASDGDEPVGGATVASRSPNVTMLAGRDDLAVLWDLRVHPDRRREGIGTRLFERAAGWAGRQGCKQLKIETQNVNVPACRFYRARGCQLGAIDRYGYAADPRVAHEAMLIWHLEL